MTPTVVKSAKQISVAQMFAPDRTGQTQAHSMARQISAEDKHGHWVGKYIFGKKLGEGGFGTVRSALNSANKERVAFKILDKVEIKDVQRVVQVRNEISLFTTLKQPNIVAGIEALTSSTRLF